jgi:hypothetical protein
MEKNWLIRTKSNHILGPISKDKMLELYRNGSIKPDDEICSGNGFWFFIRENELVEKYLLGPEIQGFNPVSEAKDVLLQKSSSTPEPTSNDITVMAQIDLKKIKDSDNVNEPINEKNQDYNSDEEIPPPVLVEEKTQDSKKKLTEKTRVNQSDKKSQSKISSTASKPKEPKKQEFLKWVGLVGFVILFCLIYFRKRIIKNFFNTDSVSFSFIDEVRADSIFEKKKSILFQ